MANLMEELKSKKPPRSRWSLIRTVVIWLMLSFLVIVFIPVSMKNYVFPIIMFVCLFYAFWYELRFSGLLALISSMGFMGFIFMIAGDRILGAQSGNIIKSLGPVIITGIPSGNTPIESLFETPYGLILIAGIIVFGLIVTRK
ncbi:TPA: hypothetical protein ENS27_16275 [bacterium]|nr:hypothetical protein [bacterium]